MRTRSQARRRRQPQVRQTSVESSNLEKPDNPPIVTMADNRTMAQLLEAPTEGYEDAIVIPEITANNFEIKHGLLNLVQNKQFFGNDKEDPHAHIRYFNKITSTMKIPNVPNTSVKLMLFPFSLEGAARIWLEKEPPRSIETWDDLVSKFINKFFPPSKTTNLRNEITRFQQKFDETFYEAWDRFNDLLRGCPHHGFSELHQLDTFYNALNSIDQDSLNSAAGGNFLDKMPRECLKIIESKSKVRQSRNKAVVAKMSTSSSTQAVSSDVAELKDMIIQLHLKFDPPFNQDPEGGHHASRSILNSGTTPPPSQTRTILPGVRKELNSKGIDKLTVHIVKILKDEEKQLFARFEPTSDPSLELSMFTLGRACKPDFVTHKIQGRGYGNHCAKSEKGKPKNPDVIKRKEFILTITAIKYPFLPREGMLRHDSCGGILVLQEFDIGCSRPKKGAENSCCKDHLQELENPTKIIRREQG
ncbi:reverse transcriptase domain-containing protein [Tanacetum coccineum]